LYLEIPGAAVARPELLTAAITLVEGWLAAAGLNDWVGLSAAEEPVLRAALLSVCLDLLVQSMHRCYRAHYQRRNSVLGGQ